MTVGTDFRIATATVNWTEPTVTDNSGVITVMANYNTSHAFPLGNTTVTYIAMDPAGNTETCSFVITVEGMARNSTVIFVFTCR